MYAINIIAFASGRLLSILRPTTVTGYLFALNFIHFHDYSSSIKFEFRCTTVTRAILDMTVTIPPGTLSRPIKGFSPATRRASDEWI